MYGQDNGNVPNGYGDQQNNYGQPQQNNYGNPQQDTYGQPQQDLGQQDFSQNQYGQQPYNQNMYGQNQNYTPKKKSKAPIIIGIAVGILLIVGLLCFGTIKLIGGIFDKADNEYEYEYSDDSDYIDESEDDVYAEDTDEDTDEEKDNSQVTKGKASKDIQAMVDQLTWKHDKLGIEFGDVKVDEYGETYKISTKLTNKSDVDMNVSFNYCIVNNFAIGISFSPYEDIKPNETLEGTVNIDKTMLDFVSNINKDTFDKFTQFEISLNAFDSNEYTTIVEQTTIGVKDSSKSYTLTEKQLEKAGLQKAYTDKRNGNKFYIGAYTNDEADDDLMCILYTECADDRSENEYGLYINEFRVQIDNIISSDAIIATSSIGGINNFEFEYISPDDFNMETLKDVEKITFTFEVDNDGDDTEKVSNIEIKVNKASLIKDLLGY